MPKTETFATLAETTTTADPGAAGTSLAVTLRTKFPQSGTFRVVVQNSETDKTNREVMIVTAGQGSGAGSFTVTRGADGTTGVAHPSGSYVAQVLTAEGLLAATDMLYNGDYAAGSYKDGDIVIYQGTAYLCVRPTSASPSAWPAPAAGSDLRYDGAWVAGLYTDGDIVIAADGVAYMAVRPTTAAPVPWATSMTGQLPPVVNGQYLKGVGSAAVWSPLTGVPGTLIAYAQLTTAGTTIALGTASAIIPVPGLAVTFTAPASGSVLVKCSILGQTQYTAANGPGIITCSMYSAGVAIGQTQQLLQVSASAGTVPSPQVRLNFSEVYTGLTPGNSYTFTPNFCSLNQNTGTLWHGAGGASPGSNPPYGPAVTEVYAV
jgi:hypothetical protein